MSNSVQMGEAVVPLFARTGDTTWTFAGTGFFVSHDNSAILVTANHVVAGRELFVFRIPGGEKAAFQFQDALHPTQAITQSIGTDLAILDPLDFNPKASLEVCDIMPPGNVRVGTFEYARFSIDSSGGTVDPGPSSRVGNVVRYITDKRFPAGSLELSYPALRGASGSPVVILEGQGTFHVAGIVIANIQYELMPAQTYVYKDAENKSEEKTHYYLPAGLAVNANHLTALISGIKNQ